MGHFFSGSYLKKINYFSKFAMYYNQELFKNASTSFIQKQGEIIQMSIEEKRKLYECGDNFVTIKDIEPWSVIASSEFSDTKCEEGTYKCDLELNKKISIYEGNITYLEIDSIVNAANSSLLGGGGVDGDIHRAAGHHLFAECKSLNGCDAGDAKITCGYKLPAKCVIHTVGPRGQLPLILEKCYRSCLKLAVENGLKTIAFPCISTGVYGYPNKDAAMVALKTVRTFLEANSKDFDRIIFCLFLDIDKKLYKKCLSVYFPIK